MRVPYFVAAIACTMLFAACGEDERIEESVVQASNGTCPRQEIQTFSPGSVINLSDLVAPCRIEFHETEIVLRGDPEGARPDPGRRIVRDRHGRFYSANAQGFPSVISLWSETGEYIKTFGGPGDGPGELSTRGGISIYVDGSDRVHVRDGGIRWSTFDDNQTFVRSVPAPRMSPSDGTLILDDGSAITAVTNPREHHFALLDSLGNIIRDIAPVDPQIMEQVPVLYGRSIVSSGPMSFWATPPNSQGYSPVGYTLEEWSASGELLRSIVRDVPWFPRIWPPPPTPRGSGPEGEQLSQRPPVQVSALHMDDDGVLMVLVTGPSPSWGPMTSQEMMALSDEERATMYEVRLELIDTRSGSLLVSQVYGGSEFPVQGMFQGVRLGFSTSTDAALLPIATIMEYSIVPN